MFHVERYPIHLAPHSSSLPSIPSHSLVSQVPTNCKFIHRKTLVFCLHRVDFMKSLRALFSYVGNIVVNCWLQHSSELPIIYLHVTWYVAMVTLRFDDRFLHHWPHPLSFGVSSSISLPIFKWEVLLLLLQRSCVLTIPFILLPSSFISSTIII